MASTISRIQRVVDNHLDLLAEGRISELPPHVVTLMDRLLTPRGRTGAAPSPSGRHPRQVVVRTPAGARHATATTAAAATPPALPRGSARGARTRRAGSPSGTRRKHVFSASARKRRRLKTAAKTIARWRRGPVRRTEFPAKTITMTIVMHRVAQLM
ncbi:unnamed protein product [Ectocarpus sp. 12 AP-2014]